MKKWSVHACGKLSFDKTCRDYGCARIHVNTPLGHLMVALTPGARWAKMRGREIVGSRWVEFTRKEKK
ncbi:hypothetical protein [Mycobacterium avium]|uniref:hypothetical protein n=1 Tax=Mycobacterium avium TaxID=1764 RepID=UPI000A966C26|nr:hypothetical protein [Mycobacterium avium]